VTGFPEKGEDPFSGGDRHMFPAIRSDRVAPFRRGTAISATWFHIHAMPRLSDRRPAGWTTERPATGSRCGGAMIRRASAGWRKVGGVRGETPSPARKPYSAGVRSSAETARTISERSGNPAERRTRHYAIRFPEGIPGFRQPIRQRSRAERARLLSPPSGARQGSALQENGHGTTSDAVGFTETVKPPKSAPRTLSAPTIPFRHPDSTIQPRNSQPTSLLMSSHRAIEGPGFRKRRPFRPTVILKDSGPPVGRRRQSCFAFARSDVSSIEIRPGSPPHRIGTKWLPATGSATPSVTEIRIRGHGKSCFGSRESGIAPSR